MKVKYSFLFSFISAYTHTHARTHTHAHTHILSLSLSLSSPKLQIPATHMHIKKHKMLGSLTFLLKPWWSIWLSCPEWVSNNWFDNYDILFSYSNKLLFNTSQLNINLILCRLFGCLNSVRSFVHLNPDGRFWLQLHMSQSCVFWFVRGNGRLMTDSR